jgi:hypothetical protein
MKINKSLQQTLDDLDSSPADVPYDTYEQRVSDKFNALYFSSAAHCAGLIIIYSPSPPLLIHPLRCSRFNLSILLEMDRWTLS